MVIELAAVALLRLIVHRFSSISKFLVHPYLLIMPCHLLTIVPDWFLRPRRPAGSMVMQAAPVIVLGRNVRLKRAHRRRHDD